jgi:hypothetical protein
VVHVPNVASENPLHSVTTYFAFAVAVQSAHVTSAFSWQPADMYLPVAHVPQSAQTVSEDPLAADTVYFPTAHVVLLAQTVSEDVPQLALWYSPLTHDAHVLQWVSSPVAEQARFTNFPPAHTLQVLQSVSAVAVHALNMYLFPAHPEQSPHPRPS